MTTLALRPATRRRGFQPLLRSEALLLMRSPGSVLWTAILPLVALVVLGSIASIRQPTKDLHGISYLSAYLPILMIFSLCMASVNLLPPTLATYREKGILRRLSTTPVPPARLLAAQAAIYLGLAMVVSVAMLVIAVAAYGVPAPRQWVGYVVSLALTGAATTGIGLVIASVATSGKAANALSTGAFFPLMFLAGLWLPQAAMPHLLRTVSEWSPLGAGVHALQQSIAGHWPPTGNLLALVAYAAVCGLVAARTFRWE
jgi:ABC-2 type transport system permease protein